jgi:transposase InsO family protein
LQSTQEPSTTSTNQYHPNFSFDVSHLWGQVKSFNGTFRDDCLNQLWFNSLEEARLLINHWRHEYNTLRPHSSVGRIPPNAFALTFTTNPTH